MKEPSVSWAMICVAFPMHLLFYINTHEQLLPHACAVIVLPVTIRALHLHLID